MEPPNPLAPTERAYGIVVPPAPPMQPPRRPSELARGLRAFAITLVLGVVVIFVIVFITASTHDLRALVSDTPTVDATSAPVPTPQTVLRLHGTGPKQSATFTVTHDQWTVSYSCRASANVGSWFIGVSVYQPDGSYTFQYAQLDCTSSRTARDSTIEHGAGDFYLKVDTIAGVTWDITVTG